MCFGYLSHIRYMIYKYFLPFCGLSFNPTNSVLCNTKVILMKSSLSVFSFVSMLLESYPRNHHQIQPHEDVLLCFF